MKGGAGRLLPSLPVPHALSCRRTEPGHRIQDDGGRDGVPALELSIAHLVTGLAQFGHEPAATGIDRQHPVARRGRGTGGGDRGAVPAPRIRARRRGRARTGRRWSGRGRAHRKSRPRTRRRPAGWDPRTGAGRLRPGPGRSRRRRARSRRVTGPRSLPGSSAPAGPARRHQPGRPAAPAVLGGRTGAVERQYQWSRPLRRHPGRNIEQPAGPTVYPKPLQASGEAQPEVAV
jgi:hypothetical protein